MTTPAEKDAMALAVKCDYCGNDAPLVSGRQVYPHRPDLFDKRFYQCAPCKAYVGCHDGTTHALGRLANAALRNAKMQAHAAFDPLWKGGKFKRKDAYYQLSQKLGIHVRDCHIGMFDAETCARVVTICKELLHGTENNGRRRASGVGLNRRQDRRQDRRGPAI